MYPPRDGVGAKQPIGLPDDGRLPAGPVVEQRHDLLGNGLLDRPGDDEATKEVDGARTLLLAS